eukprot:2417161-Prorocentrum_lima.AAC.1
MFLPCLFDVEFETLLVPGGGLVANSGTSPDLNGGTDKPVTGATWTMVIACTAKCDSTNERV